MWCCWEVAAKWNIKVENFLQKRTRLKKMKTKTSNFLSKMTTASRGY